MKSEDMEYGRMSTISGGMYIVAREDGGCHLREAWPGVCSSVLQCTMCCLDSNVAQCLL